MGRLGLRKPRISCAGGIAPACALPKIANEADAVVQATMGFFAESRVSGMKIKQPPLAARDGRCSDIADHPDQ